MSKHVIKFSLNRETRRREFEQVPTLGIVKQAVLQTFPQLESLKNVSLIYQDEDNDDITIGSEEEFQSAWNSVNTRGLGALTVCIITEESFPSDISESSYDLIHADDIGSDDEPEDGSPLQEEDVSGLKFEGDALESFNVEKDDDAESFSHVVKVTDGEGISSATEETDETNVEGMEKEPMEPSSSRLEESQAVVETAIDSQASEDAASQAEEILLPKEEVDEPVASNEAEEPTAREHDVSAEAQITAPPSEDLVSSAELSKVELEVENADNHLDEVIEQCIGDESLGEQTVRESSDSLHEPQHSTDRSDANDLEEPVSSCDIKEDIIDAELEEIARENHLELENPSIESPLQSSSGDFKQQLEEEAERAEIEEDLFEMDPLCEFLNILQPMLTRCRENKPDFPKDQFISFVDGVASYVKSSLGRKADVDEPQADQSDCQKKWNLFREQLCDPNVVTAIQDALSSMVVTRIVTKFANVGPNASLADFVQILLGEMEPILEEIGRLMAVVPQLAINTPLIKKGLSYLFSLGSEESQPAGATTSDCCCGDHCCCSKNDASSTSDCCCGDHCCCSKNDASSSTHKSGDESCNSSNDSTSPEHKCCCLTEECGQLAEKQVHRGVRCDGCLSDPELRAISIEKGFAVASDYYIRGIRYKSAIADDFDLCECCEATGKFDQDKAPFLRIKNAEMEPVGIFCVLGDKTTTFGRRRGAARRMAHRFMERNMREKNRPNRRQQPAATMGTQVSEDEPAIGQVTCVNNHALKSRVARDNRYRCDVCEYKILPGSHFFECRPCDWDICSRCYNKREASTEVSASSEPTPAPVRQVPISSCRSLYPVIQDRPQAKFVTDASHQDGSVLRPGQPFTKVWRVQNVGKSQWPSGCRIVCVGGDRMEGPFAGVELPRANPDAVVDVRVPLRAPVHVGRYNGYWRMITPNNVRFGSRLWVDISVAGNTPEQITAQLLHPIRHTIDLVTSSLPNMEPSAPTEAEVATPEGRYSLYVDQLERLTDMGFCDIERNVELLEEHDGNLEEVALRLSH